MVNVPHLILQMSSSILFSRITTITIIACVFSVVSIFLAITAYKFKKSLLDYPKLCVIDMKIKCDDIGHLEAVEFHKKISNRRFGIKREISKLVEMPQDKVEFLKPVQDANGARILFYIESKYVSEANDIFKVFENGKNDECLVQIFSRKWNFESQSLVIDSIDCKTVNLQENKEFNKRRDDAGATETREGLQMKHRNVNSKHVRMDSTISTPDRDSSVAADLGLLTSEDTSNFQRKTKTKSKKGSKTKSNSKTSKGGETQLAEMQMQMQTGIVDKIDDVQDSDESRESSDNDESSKSSQQSDDDGIKYNFDD